MFFGNKNTKKIEENQTPLKMSVFVGAPTLAEEFIGGRWLLGEGKSFIWGCAHW